MSEFKLTPNQYAAFAAALGVILRHRDFQSCAGNPWSPYLRDLHAKLVRLSGGKLLVVARAITDEDDFLDLRLPRLQDPPGFSFTPHVHVEENAVFVNGKPAEYELEADTLRLVIPRQALPEGALSALHPDYLTPRDLVFLRRFAALIGGHPRCTARGEVDSAVPMLDAEISRCVGVDTHWADFFRVNSIYMDSPVLEVNTVITTKSGPAFVTPTHLVFSEPTSVVLLTDVNWKGIL